MAKTCPRDDDMRKMLINIRDQMKHSTAYAAPESMDDVNIEWAVRIECAIDRFFAQHPEKDEYDKATYGRSFDIFSAREDYELVLQEKGKQNP
ncbi:Hypothetical protein UVM_LOCUS24 [uncultured virus]|nr:Hypothetical protein UVM_LOCUS24 [uncultured virus]